MWQSTDAARLAEVTSAQLREWTKRGIITPDVAGRGAGHHALYGWQTVLVISAIGKMRSRFGIELGRWAEPANAARKVLDQVSFLRLWGSLLVFQGGPKVGLVFKSSDVAVPSLVVELDPHLARLANEMQLPGAPSQLPLLAPIGSRL